MMNLKDKLYTSTEVADILGVSLRSIYRYLEDGKLVAEVKTATGRHRFTKENIVNFLYPDGEVPEGVLAEDSAQPAPAKVSVKVTTPEATSVEATPEVTIKTEAAKVEVEPAPAKVEEPEEEEVDWLTKFREAAAKFEETETATVKEAEAVSGLADMSSDSQEEVSAANDTVLYYRSGVGGLREIAQNVDKTARSSNVEYAFTMSAGLSLHKLVKPFSVLHVYVKPDTRTLFENALRLQQVAEDNAELALILDGNDSIYQSKEERHGLFVVAPERLLVDAKQYGDDSLISEAQSILA